MSLHVQMHLKRKDDSEEDKDDYKRTKDDGEPKIIDLRLCIFFFDHYNYSIIGLASVGDEFFVLRKEKCYIEVYRLPSTEPSRVIQLSEMLSPKNMASCTHNKVLYISDDKLNCIFKVNLQSEVITRIDLRVSDLRGISVTSEHTLLAITYRTNPARAHWIAEYSSEGELIRETALDESVVKPWQAVKLSSDRYAVVHGWGGPVHRACLLDEEGRVIKTYGNAKGIEADELHTPRAIVADSRETSKRIYVADSCNHRIRVFDFDLNFLGLINTPKNIRFLNVLHFDEQNDWLISGSSSYLEDDDVDSEGKEESRENEKEDSRAEEDKQAEKVGKYEENEGKEVEREKKGKREEIREEKEAYTEDGEGHNKVEGKGETDESREKEENEDVEQEEEEEEVEEEEEEKEHPDARMCLFFLEDEQCNRKIDAITTVDDEIFVLRRRKTIIDVHKFPTLELTRTINVPEMQYPESLVACAEKKLLYMCGEEEYCIVKVDLQSNVNTRIDIEIFISFRLSITYDHNLIVITWKGDAERHLRIAEYSCNDDQLVRETELDSSMANLYQAVKLSADRYAVYQPVDASSERICIIDLEGIILKSYETDKVPLRDRSYGIRLRSIAVDSREQSKKIFITDTDNDRILMFDFDLKYLGRANRPKSLQWPSAMWFDEKHNMLLVSGYDPGCFIRGGMDPWNLNLDIEYYDQMGL